MLAVVRKHNADTYYMLWLGSMSGTTCCVRAVLGVGIEPTLTTIRATYIPCTSLNSCIWVPSPGLRRVIKDSAQVLTALHHYV